MTLQTHKDLKVWQESKDLVTKIYALTSKFPKEEIYSITAQIKRAAISIPSNIACPVK
jgi:four helix bundle protein